MYSRCHDQQVVLRLGTDPREVATTMTSRFSPSRVGTLFLWTAENPTITLVGTEIRGRSTKPGGYDESAQPALAFDSRGSGIRDCDGQRSGPIGERPGGSLDAVSISGDPDGPNPRGRVTFDAGGRFVQVITRSDVPKYTSGKRNEGTADEYEATALGSLGFFGTYTVDGTNLTWHVEASSYPNMVGSDQKLANLTLTGDELKWTNPAPPVGGQSIVVLWKRAK